MKTQIHPPARLKAQGLCAASIPDRFRGAWGIVDEIGSGFRYRGLIIGEVQRDLIRFAALHGQPVYFALRGEMAPCPIFSAETAERWLGQGGRTWIIAELEARSSRRVVAFPGAGGRP